MELAAGEPRDKPITAAECVQRALAENRALQIERINPRIAQLTLEASYGVYDPILTVEAANSRIADTGGYDPRDLSKDDSYEAEAYTVTPAVTGLLPWGLTYSLNGDFASTSGDRNNQNFDAYNVSVGFTLQQPLLRNAWVDAARTTVRINRKNLRTTELGVEYIAATVVNQVRQAYCDLVLARENLRVQETLLAVRERFDTETRQRVKVGALSNLDEKLAQAQVAQVRVALIAARNQVSLAENALKTLLGDDFISSAEVRLVPSDRLLPVPAVLDLQESWREGLARRADLCQLRLDVEKADIELKYYRNQLWPSLDLVGGYGRRGSSKDLPLPPAKARASLHDAIDEIDDNVAPNSMVGVIFSLPLSRKLERSNYRLSKERREQFLLMVKQREELVLREISDAFQNALTAHERVEATRVARESAEAAVQAEEQKLAAGRSTSFFVLSLQGDLATAQSQEILAQADYHKALSQLHFAEGTLLEREHLEIEWR